jgi:hypothetical protein
VTRQLTKSTDFRQNYLRETCIPGVLAHPQLQHILHALAALVGGANAEAPGANVGLQRQGHQLLAACVEADPVEGVEVRPRGRLHQAQAQVSRVAVLQILEYKSFGKKMFFPPGKMLLYYFRQKRGNSTLSGNPVSRSIFKTYLPIIKIDYRYVGYAD